MNELETMQCPECGSTEPDSRYIKDGMFVCGHRDEKGIMCGTIVGILCKQCNKIYGIENFGFRNDAYECKECGKLQWGVTEYKKDKAKLKADMEAAMRGYQSDINFFNSIISSKKR